MCARFRVTQLPGATNNPSTQKCRNYSKVKYTSTKTARSLMLISIKWLINYFWPQPTSWLWIFENFTLGRALLDSCSQVNFILENVVQTFSWSTPTNSRRNFYLVPSNRPRSAITESVTVLGVEPKMVGLIHKLMIRRMVTTTLETSTQTRLVNRDTSQGGVLSPLLWNSAVNKFPRIPEGGDCKVFAIADDVIYIYNL